MWLLIKKLPSTVPIWLPLPSTSKTQICHHVFRIAGVTMPQCIMPPPSKMMAKKSATS